MRYRGLLDRKGELFAYLEGNVLYTLDGEVTGRLEGNYVVDTAGNQIWRILNDGVFTLDRNEAIGYFSSWTPDDD
jgi:hypothetical protein